MPKKIIEVAVGVILQQDQVLLAQRTSNQHLAGKWEFPGGKIESGESVFDALKRELFEECAITATQIEPLITIEHDYGDKQVKLITCIVKQFKGNEKGAEGQIIKWADVSELATIDFPEANKSIVDALNQYLGYPS